MKNVKLYLKNVENNTKKYKKIQKISIGMKIAYYILVYYKKSSIKWRN